MIVADLYRIACADRKRATALEQLAKAHHAVANTWPLQSDTYADYVRRAQGVEALAAECERSHDQHFAAACAVDDVEPGSEAHLIAIAEGAQLLRGGIEGSEFRDYLQAEGGLTEEQADVAVCLYEQREAVA